MTIEEVDKLAQLAKLEFSHAEKCELLEHLERIVGYVETLKQLDVRDVPPTSHVLPLSNVFRDDVVEPSMAQEDVLRNAPKQKQGYFSVPKVISNPDNK